MRTIEPKIIDLTHALLPSIPSWDGSCGFHIEIDTDYKDCAGPDFFRTQRINARAGMGTHIDAPAHCFENTKTIDTLSLEDLFAECVVIRLDNAPESAIFTPELVEKHEHIFGQIPDGSFVIFDSGWARFWNDPERYRNNLQFPSVHVDTASLLLERGIAGLGTDTLSPDCGGKLFPVHRKVLGAGRYLVENIADAGLLPAVGSRVFIAPMKIYNGTEAPIRLIAFPYGFSINYSRQ